MTASTLFPWALTWSDVDPLTHAFDASNAYTIALGLIPSTKPSDHAWMQSITQAFVSHYGRWACGWNYSLKDGQKSAWCCPNHSFSTPDVTAGRIQGALIEWRQWIETLASRFDTFKATPQEDLTTAFERAAVLLVTDVVEYTEATEAWYGHCEQVLGWYLEMSGVSVEQARELISAAIGGRFESWIAPDDCIIDDVANQIAIKASKILKNG